MKKEKGYIYARGNVLWMAWYDAQGRRHCTSTKCPLGDEQRAQALLEAVQRRVRDEIRAGGPLTVARWAARWLDDRDRRGLGTAKDDRTRLERHALPKQVSGQVFGEMLLNEVKRTHVRELVRELLAAPLAERLASRSIRHVYALLRTMFQDACEEGVLAANPCTLRAKKGELPMKRDKDPEWRAQAVYDRAEVELLLSDERLPLARRVLYAGLFLTGCRISEWAARRWRDWEPHLEPLGRLLVATSYSRKQKHMKA